MSYFWWVWNSSLTVIFFQHLKDPLLCLLFSSVIIRKNELWVLTVAPLKAIFSLICYFYNFFNISFQKFYLGMAFVLQFSFTNLWLYCFGLKVLSHTPFKHCFCAILFSSETLITYIRLFHCFPFIFHSFSIPLPLRAENFLLSYLPSSRTLSLNASIIFW